MNLNPISDKFINNYFLGDTLTHKKVKLLIRCSLLTSLFSTSYLFISYFVDFPVGVYTMIFNVSGYLLFPFLFKYRIDLRLAGNIFIFMGASAILLVAHYAGGLWSPNFIWLSAVPVLAAFLVNRHSAIFWGILMFTFTVCYGVADILNIKFSVTYNVEYKSFFLISSYSGFLLIILLISMVFESNTRQAVKSLEIINKKMVEVNNEKDYIIQIMAHDLRNPLFIIKSWLEILRSDTQQVDSPEEVYIMMEESVNKSVKLIDKVTKIGVVEQENLQVALENMDLREIVLRVCEAYQNHAKAKDISLKKEWQEQDYEARIDTTYFSQIVDNLISNAVKYTRKGGKVLVEMLKDNGDLQIRVIDEGPGLSVEDQKKLFKKFSRLNVKPTGGESSTGLGLYLVQKYANLMDGNVWCESELGKGSKFILSIPETLNQK